MLFLSVCVNRVILIYEYICALTKQKIFRKISKLFFICIHGLGFKKDRWYPKVSTSIHWYMLEYEAKDLNIETKIKFNLT